MLRHTLALRASKISGGHARNQAGAPRKKHVQFHVFLNTPVSTEEPIKRQRQMYGKTKYSRLPEYRAGANVEMSNDFTLTATVKGVVSVRKSKINPGYKWVDVDPDIQKIRRSNEIRAELQRRGETTTMLPTNEDYKAEYDVMQEPTWRERVLRVRHATERFADPNLLCRGVIDELKPLDRYDYE